MLSAEVTASRSESAALRKGVTNAKKWISTKDYDKAVTALDGGKKTADGHRRDADKHRDARKG